MCWQRMSGMGAETQVLFRGGPQLRVHDAPNLRQVNRRLVATLRQLRNSKKKGKKRQWPPQQQSR
jgi:type VI protein secretion system component VasF